MQYNNAKKCISILLSIVIALSLFTSIVPSVAAAENGIGANAITAFLDIPGSLVVEPGTDKADLALPEALLVAITNEFGEETTQTIAGVTWECADYVPDTAGVYIFSAVLPDGYILSDSVTVPVVEIFVSAGEEEAAVPAAEDNTAVIIAFAPKPYHNNPDDPEAAYITVDLGTEAEDIPFPMSLAATIDGGAENEYEVAVQKWMCDNYGPDTAGVYEFSPLPALKENEIIAEGVILPVIEVVVTENVEIATAAETIFEDGDGTEERPYQIISLEQLVALSAEVNAGNDDYNSKYYILNDDIDLSEYENGEGWTPAGTVDNPFKGHFDGNNKKITNLTINSPDGDCLGLFGVISEGSVKNLGVEDVNVTGHGNVGGIAGVAANSSIENCYSTGKISSAEGEDNSVGGIVGRSIDNTTVKNCYSTGEISSAGGESSAAGGIVGAAANSSVENCYSTGDVIGGHFVGGVVGYAETVSVTNCYAAGSISGDGSVGGIIGAATESSVVENCAALTPEVSASGEDGSAGRLAGYSESVIFQNNYAFIDMKNTDGAASWANKGADDSDGADITAQDVMSSVFWTEPDGINCDDDIWEFEDDKLPILLNVGENQTGDLPEHLIKTLESVSVTGVALDKTLVTLALGETLTLTAAVSPENASITTVTWSSDNTNVATVNKNGLVFAKGGGAAKITVTTDDGGKTAVCTVNVHAPVASITLDKKSSVIQTGETIELSATVLPNEAANKNLLWLSSDEKVATVDTKGNVTGVGEGTAKITAAATDDSGKSDVCNITVSSIKLPEIMIDKPYSVITANGGITLSANKVAKWSIVKGGDIIQFVGYTAGTGKSNVSIKALDGKTGDAQITASYDKSGVKYTTTAIVEVVSGEPTFTLLETKTTVNAAKEIGALLPIKADYVPTGTEAVALKKDGAVLTGFSAKLSADKRYIEISAASGTRSASAVEVFIGGVSAKDKLSITVTEKYPKITLSLNGTLNTFYSGRKANISAKAADGSAVTVEKAEYADTKDSKYVKIGTDMLTLNPVKSGTASLVVTVKLNGYKSAFAQGVNTVKFSAKVVDTAPKLKLSATNISLFSTDAANISLLASDTKALLSSYGVSNVVLSPVNAKNQPVTNADVAIDYSQATGDITVTPKSEIAGSGSAMLKVVFYGTDAAVYLPLKIASVSESKLTPSSKTKTVLVNKAHKAGTVVTIPIAFNATNVSLNDWKASVTEGNSKVQFENSVLNSAFEAISGSNSLTLRVKDIYALKNLVANNQNKTYTLNIGSPSLKNNKTLTVKLTVVGKDSAVTVSVKGKFDIADPQSEITATAKIANTNSEINNIKLFKAGTSIADSTFIVSDIIGNTFKIGIADGIIVTPSVASKLDVEVTLKNGEKIRTAKKKPITITPSQTVGKVWQSTKEIGLHRLLPFEGANIDLSLLAPPNGEIGHVELDKTTINNLNLKQGGFELVRSGLNSWTISLKNGIVPQNSRGELKNCTIKLNVWAKGTYSGLDQYGNAVPLKIPGTLGKPSKTVSKPSSASVKLVFDKHSGTNGGYVYTPDSELTPDSTFLNSGEDGSAAITRLKWISDLVKAANLKMVNDGGPKSSYSDIDASNPYFESQFPSYISGEVEIARQNNAIPIGLDNRFYPERAATEVFAVVSAVKSLGFYYENLQDIYTIANDCGIFIGTPTSDNLTTEQANSILNAVKSIVAPVTINPSAPQVVDISSDVIKLQSGSVNDYSIDPDIGTGNIKLNSTANGLVSAGDCIMLPADDIYPGGLAQKVISVTEQPDGTFALVTEAPGIEEIIGENGISVQGNFKGSINNFIINSNLQEELGNDWNVVNKLNANKAMANGIAPYADAPFEITIGTSIENGKPYIDVGISANSGDDSLGFSAKVFEPTVDAYVDLDYLEVFGADTIPIGVNYFYAAVNNEAEFSATANTKFIDKKVKIGEIPIPLGQPALTANVILYLDFSLEGSVELKYSIDSTVGVEYINKHMRTVDNATSDTTLTLEAEMEAGIRAATALKLVGLELADVNARAGLGANASLTLREVEPESCLEIKTYLYIKLAALQEGIISDLLDLNLEVDIWNKDNSPVRKEWHFEGSPPQKVPECTFGGDVSLPFYNNLSFEDGYSGWVTSGDSRIVSSLGTLKPTNGQKMAVAGTGFGAVNASNSRITRSFVIPGSTKYLTLDYNFISEEPMEFVNSIYDDTLIFSVIEKNGVEHEIKRLTVNTAQWKYLGGNYFPSGDSTTYHTGWMGLTIDVSAYTEFTLVTNIYDLGDSIFDSAVLVDNLRFTNSNTSSAMGLPSDDQSGSTEEEIVLEPASDRTALEALIVSAKEVDPATLSADSAKLLADMILRAEVVRDNPLVTQEMVDNMVAVLQGIIGEGAPSGLVSEAASSTPDVDFLNTGEPEDWYLQEDEEYDEDILYDIAG